MRLHDVPLTELKQLAEANEVTDFRCGFDVRGLAVLVKFKIGRGEVALFRFPSTVILTLAGQIAADAAKKGWAVEQSKEDLEFTDVDWRVTESVVAYRVERFEDGLILALPTHGDEFQVLRLRPGFAVSLAADVLTAQKQGHVRGLDTHNPPGSPAH